MIDIIITLLERFIDSRPSFEVIRWNKEDLVVKNTGGGRAKNVTVVACSSDAADKVHSELVAGKLPFTREMRAQVRSRALGAMGAGQETTLNSEWGQVDSIDGEGNRWAVAHVVFFFTWSDWRNQNPVLTLFRSRSLFVDQTDEHWRPDR